MKRHDFILVFLCACLAAPACGDEPKEKRSESVDPPDASARDLPTAGGPPADAGFDAPPPQEEYVPEDRDIENADGECCQVTFAIAPSSPEEVEEAVLRGSLFPLDTADGVVLQDSGGVWTGEACLAPDQFATYRYELSLETEGSDEPFSSVAHNPYAPTTTSAGEVVNAWVPGEDCASIDVAVHAQTSE